MERIIEYDLTEAAATHDIAVQGGDALTIQINRTGVTNAGANATVTLTGSLDGVTFSGNALPGCFASGKTIPAGTGVFFWRAYGDGPVNLNIKYLRVSIDPGGASAGTGSIYLLIR